MALAASMVAATESPSRTIVMLHGIYGRGRNWLTIARVLTEVRPEYGCWLVDLPHHGGSEPGTHGDTIPGLAADLEDWLAAEGVTPAALLGHSYGGKVALAAGARRTDTPLQIWIVDSTPASRSPSGSAWAMLETVRGLPPRFASRDEAIAGLTTAGFTEGVARWMATNLARDGDGFTWRLDFDAMERLLRDFFARDLWPTVEAPPADHEIHFIKARESSVLSGEAVERIQRARPGRVHLHQLEGGHWIHAERPDLVAGLLERHLP